MPASRPTPFALVFGAGAAERFAALRAGIEAAGRDPRDRDAFLLVREVTELLHELHPEGAGPEAIQALVAFVHYAYLYWMDGERVVEVNAVEELVGKSGGREVGTEPRGQPTLPTLPTSRPPDFPTRYVRLPALRIWGTPLEGHPPEPLDGWFVSRAEAQLSLLAIFGLNAARAGFSAVEATGPRPVRLERSDGSPLFSPTLSGAAGAGLASVVGEEELLELGWRAEERG